MPDTFTMSELRAVYEQLLGGRLEPRGFIRRIDELDILEETGDTKTEGHRPARYTACAPARKRFSSSRRWHLGPNARALPRQVPPRRVPHSLG